MDEPSACSSSLHEASDTLPRYLRHLVVRRRSECELSLTLTRMITHSTLVYDQPLPDSHLELDVADMDEQSTQILWSCVLPELCHLGLLTKFTVKVVT